MNVLFSQASPVAMQNSSWKYYITFIVLNAVDFFIIAFMFPETKGKTLYHLLELTLISFIPAGKSLEEMAEVFGDEVNVSDVLAKERKHSGGESPIAEKGSVEA